MKIRAGLCAVAMVAAGLVAAPPAVAADVGSATVVPIQVTGDPAKRFNLVVLGDGYTEADLPTFRSHVDKHLNTLWTIEPFKSYRSYVNVYAVEIISAESGVDCDPGLSDPRRNTVLGMGFWGGCNPGSVQRLLTVNGSAANTYANLATGTNPGNRQLIALANSNTYGGAGGTNATASGGNALSALISPHELGHSLGGLQDEYDYYARAVPGDTYTGGEPSSVHHTVLTEQQMRDTRTKWWRWLGEPSESGGTIGRYEGGLYLQKGVWRPSQHSMMKSLGFYFDQVARERMTERIAAKVTILSDGTPTNTPIGADRVVWVETLHPVSHELSVTWSVDGAAVPGTGNARSLDLRSLRLPPGRHTVTATVTDPTPFVRDPAVRDSPALTQRRSWTVDTALTTPAAGGPLAITASTATDRPVGAQDVVYVQSTHPTDRVPAVSWAVDGRPVANPGHDGDLELAALDLSGGSHRLVATLSDPVTHESVTREWAVDAARPQVDYDVSAPLLTTARPGRPTEYVYNGPFSMELTGTDGGPGQVTSEFRLDGDGWHNYYGWPTDARAPFLFTATGTDVDGLVYGNLGSGGLSVSPFAQRSPGYGRHTIEYRGIDAVGNIGPAGSFVATLIPAPPACTDVVSGRHPGGLVVSSGVTCLRDATVSGAVVVRPGAALVAERSAVSGSLAATGATAVELLNTSVRGAVSVTGTTGHVTVVGARVAGAMVLSGNVTGTTAPIVAGTEVATLACSGNSPAPVDLGAPNTVRGSASGQCRAR
ncbi:M64 family metallopeptidase [Micromonospora sp. WMMD812]|uniref:M64 family metallopeptidase n=1 Tax=Micromonospora sp. WMMD812 TaxID=3015152 RepID=UPI00248CA06A|nr:M64 family metallopeptidase [Micromonospora sp. WMMD812]WBB69997.1 M64 family metallo-endopeptidase [Micromonospora sp. WMMD812]